MFVWSIKERLHSPTDRKTIVGSLLPRSWNEDLYYQPIQGLTLMQGGFTVQLYLYSFRLIHSTQQVVKKLKVFMLDSFFKRKENTLKERGKKQISFVSSFFIYFLFLICWKRNGLRNYFCLQNNEKLFFFSFFSLDPFFSSSFLDVSYCYLCLKG